MKKLLGIAAICMAFSPLVQAASLPGNPDARNDRSPSEYMEHKADHASSKAKHKAHKAKHKMKRAAHKAKEKMTPDSAK